MSHFTVMVIGPKDRAELEKVLAPFDENLEVVEVTEDDETWWTNPDAKWDWWVVGGRWSGRLRLREGAVGENGDIGCASAARAGDVDWAAMADDSVMSMLPTWELVHAAIKDYGPLPPLPADGASRDDWAAWSASPTMHAIKTGAADHWLSVDTIVELATLGHDDFVARYAARGLSCYATLRNGEWIQPGEMGWFGMSSDTADSRREYDARVAEMIWSLPADEMVWVVDCHI